MADGSSGEDHQPEPESGQMDAQSRGAGEVPTPEEDVKLPAGEPRDNLAAPVGILTAAGIGLLLWIVIIIALIWLL